MRTDIVIKRPLITEKTMGLAGSGKYSFVVDSKANKQQITDAVNALFKVEVTNVSTIKVKGKTKRFGSKRQPVVMAPIKKAIVELKKGQKIDIFEITEEKK